ncbi:MAG: DNA helicase RecQ [Aestuariibacter sp.]
MMDRAYSTLKEVFGYHHFRPQQEAIISSVLAGHHTLAILPTGGGKSLCYQIPALLFDGMTLVVSPLISLMQDQVRQLKALDISTCLLNSTLSREEYLHNVQRIQQDQIKLLFLAPETLLQNSTLELLQQRPVACVAIDEAHCISEWGHEFRPEYRKLHQLQHFFPKAIRIALTATATPRVRQDMRTQLTIGDAQEFVASFNRDNLFLEVLAKNNAFGQCCDFIDKHKGQSGIVYCQSRKQVDELVMQLQHKDYSVAGYHAGLSNEQRHQCQEQFVRDDIQIIVATVAFGMGINKPDVRFVLHYDLPKNIESYYQQIGRAGRDGEPADCLLLFSYGDTGKVRFFIDQMQQEQEKRIANMHLNQMLAFVETEDCRRVPLLNYFAETPDSAVCGKCDNCCNEKKEKADLTVAAQMFLSCVFRTESRFGANYIADVLRGSNAAKILQNQHNLLSTYGIGKDLTKKQWLALSRQLLQKGLLHQDEQFGSLKLTAQAKAVLTGGQKFMGVLQEERAIHHTSKTLPDNVDTTLLSELKATRKRLADAASLPPFAIFPDRTLNEMASFFPQSAESLLQLQGVGQVKLQKFGTVFLDIIKRYCASQDIAEIPHPKMKQASAQKEKKTGGKALAIAMEFNNGSSLAQLAESHNIKPSTIISHLHNYVQEGHALANSMALLDDTQTPAQQTEQVMSAFESLGTERLKPLFDAMQGKVSYDDLHLLRVYFCATRNANTS